MNKKLIRLTEADLHRIVRESVNNVLNEMVDEGQGWDFFNSVRKDYKNGYLYLDSYNERKNDDDFRQDKNQFIKYGTPKGNENDTLYDRENPDYKTATDANNPGYTGKINKGFTGKLGRRAGVAAAQGYLGYQTLKNKLRGK